MVVFSTFFGRLGGMNERMAPGTPYALYTFCALLPWQMFGYALTQSANSVVSSRGLLTKVYFPRVLIPMVPLPCALIDFGVSFTVLGVMMFWFDKWPGVAVLVLPLFLLLALLAALAVGLWLSALNALYRDVQYTVPFLAQLWFFATPIAYPSSIVPVEWRLLYGLNPMVGVVEGFRWALLGGIAPGGMVFVSVAMTLVLLVSGLFFFRRMERTFADLV
jgi:lipopolysaccharide transport system permease protein